MTLAPHLTDIKSLPEAAFTRIIDESLDYRDAMDAGAAIEPTLGGRLQFNLFYENSTRTNLSFEVAAKRLGAIVSVVPVAASSVHKGETVDDTILTLAAQGADFIVLRTGETGALSRAIDALEREGLGTSMINGGEGAHGHPTQGLLDAAALLHRLGRRAADGLGDQIITICGDVRHSRVAVSAIEAFHRLGAEIRLMGPASLLPEETPPGVTQQTDSIDEALSGATVAMALRIQHERLSGALDLTDEAYALAYGLDHDRLAGMAPDGVIMHPGPMNRGVEITGALADDPERSIIRSQVRQGVAVRMAVCNWIEAARTAP